MESETSLRKVAIALCVCGVVLGLAVSLIGCKSAGLPWTAHVEPRWSAN